MAVLTMTLPNFAKKYCIVTHHIAVNNLLNSRYRKYGVPSQSASLPKTVHAYNEYSCDTFNKLILASIDIIHRCPQNSWFY